ncbi:MAG: amidohydrolase family protein [Myxococcota bacterium]|nr:amidohydrolase family protein [Myxococcota bacterium]
MGNLLIRNAKLVDGSGGAPSMADVKTSGDRIAEIDAAGSLDAGGATTIDADGRLLTPGFVDVHTHYDGQATWDPILAPSSWHGVTTAVMGNCGVGFAPARPDERRALIELMEGVEDIPGTALHDGIQWDWETFPEYLAALEKLPRTIELATQIPHGALRAYVMGERGVRQEPATEADLKEMSDHVREAVRAGALAFSTNRMPLHTSIHGDPVPGTFAEHHELETLTRAVIEGGGHLLQAIPAGASGEEQGGVLREVDLYRDISLATGATVTFSAPQVHAYPDEWREMMRRTHEANAAGARLVPQVLGRGGGLMLSLDTFNPFGDRPSYSEIADLPIAQRLAKMREPERRARILAEQPPDSPTMLILGPALNSTFAMEDGPVFEPESSESIGARAQAAGVDPMHLLYDVMCDLAERSETGRTRMMAVFFVGYADGDLEAVGEMMRDSSSVVGLADGGAHCSMICDASLPTFVLAHWVRDRSRGERLSIEHAIKLLSKEPADLYGLGDRGLVEVGRRADLNLIDLDRVELDLPEITADLPTGASRILQRGHGYVATICGGEVTFLDGEPTGARPAGVIRGAR